jgi:hypothetical protein
MLLVYARRIDVFSVVHMKDRLLIATLVVIGFLATLGLGAMRGGLSQPVTAPLAAAPSPTRLQADTRSFIGADRAAAPTPAADAAMPPPSAAPEPTPAESVTAPTYEEQTAARDRATAHGARSR